MDEFGSAIKWCIENGNWNAMSVVNAKRVRRARQELEALMVLRDAAHQLTTELAAVDEALSRC